MNTNWKRAAVGVCTATALVVGAGLAFAPAANAVPATDPSSSTTGLLTGVTTGVTGVVGNLLGGGTTSSTPTTSSPVTIGTSSDGLAVGVGSTTVGVTTGNGVGVAVGTGNGSGVAVRIGGTTTGVDVTGGVSGGASTSTSTNTNTNTNTSTSTSTSTSTGTGTTGGGTSAPVSTAPATLSALSVTSQYQTVYPAKDGYRDTVAFQLNGTASDGLQHTAGGTATLSFGSTTVRTWPITATNQTIVWDGLKAAKLVPGSYTFSAVISDADGHQISGTDKVAVSAKKITSTTSVFSTKSVSGTHKMAAKPLAGLSKGKVYLRVVANVSGIKGKQYLVFSHAGKKVKVRIKNGKHTSARVTIPKSFTTYTTSHTWKKSAVTIKSLKYKYSYKALK